MLLLLATAATGFRRTAHPVAAGVFAFVAVIAFVAFLGALWTWFGWESASPTSSSFRGFHAARFLLELLWLRRGGRRRPRLPLSAARRTGGARRLDRGHRPVVERRRLVGRRDALRRASSISTFALAVDSGARRPYGFWLHVGAGLLIGGSLLWFWHGGNFEWGLIAIAAVVFVFFSQPTGRSSWAVFGTIGLLLASIHFALEWTHVRVVFFSGGSAADRPWVSPLVFTLPGRRADLARAGCSAAAVRPPQANVRRCTRLPSCVGACRAGGLARRRPLLLRLRHRRVPRVAPWAAAVGRAAPGDRQPHTTLVRARQRAGRRGRALPRLVARLEARPGHARERRSDRPLRRPRAAARVRPGPSSRGRSPRAPGSWQRDSFSSASARRSTSARPSGWIRAATV